MKIKQLQLSKALFVPGVGQLPTTIGTVHHPAEMNTIDGGVLCIAKGHAFLIPYDMIEAAYVGPVAGKSGEVVNASKAVKKD